MPHIVVEYTENLGHDVAGRLLRSVHDAADGTHAFAPGAIRSRAIALDRYIAGDGRPGSAFVHIAMRIRPGRDEADRQRIARAVFDAAEACLATSFDAGPLGLTLELTEIDLAHRLMRSTL